MAIQLGTTLRNNMINQYESTVGTAARILIFTGSQPSDCQASTSGTLLVNMVLPSDWYNAASNGTATKLGTWEGTAIASGVAGHFRLYNNGQTVCHEQGSVGTSSADLVIDNTNIASGQIVTVTAWTRSNNQG